MQEITFNAEQRVLALRQHDAGKFNDDVERENLQLVTVEFWHMVNDELVGFVSEFVRDIPARWQLPN